MSNDRESMPLVSIIMPAFNAQQYIAESIQSALSQTYQNIEVIVVDDGSKDDTKKIADSFGVPVFVHSVKNGGAAAARNYGVNQANGDWIAFLDSDDIWEPTNLETQMNNLDGKVWSHADSVFFGVGHDGTVTASALTPKFGGRVVPTLAVNNFIGTTTVIVRKDVFLEEGGFDPEMLALEDWDLWLKIAGKHELSYCPDILAKYRVHAASTSRGARRNLPYHLKIIEKTFSSNGVGKDLMHMKKSALADSYEISSLIAEEGNDPWFALSCALQALKLQPFKLWRWKCVLRVFIFKIVGAPLKK